MNFKFENGSRVKSKITKFEGIITARADHLYGCNRYFVTPPVGKESKLPDGYWHDEAELEIICPDILASKNNELGGFPSKVK